MCKLSLSQADRETRLTYTFHDGENLIRAGDRKAPISLGVREGRVRGGGRRDGLASGRSRCRYNREACLSSKCPCGSPSPTTIAANTTGDIGEAGGPR